MPTVTTQQKIAGLYVAFFNRAPDKAGLAFWDNEFAGGKSIYDLAAGFAQHPTFATTYGGMTNNQFVQAIYKNMLGGEGDAAGIQYWTTRLNSNELTQSKMVAEFVTGALQIDLAAWKAAAAPTEADYAAAMQRQQLITNKANVALQFVNQLGDKSNVKMATGDLSTDAAYLASIAAVSEVDHTQASVSNAIAKLISSAQSTDPVAAILATSANENNVFTLTEVAPEIAKTFVWENVDTSSIKEMLKYANEINNRGGSLVTNAAEEGTANTNSLFFDSEYVESMSNWINNYAALTDEQLIFNPANLTTSGTTVGVMEAGNTGKGNDTIIAGTAAALHGAYIDGGAGRNTLEVEMKGPFAQAKQLLNIQEIHVHNTTDYYTNTLFDYNNAAALRGGATIGADDFVQNVATNSVLDLTNARQLDKLVITESGAANNNLIVLGIKNYADTKLVGGFDADVTLHYTDLGSNSGKVLNLEMVNVDFGIAPNAGKLNLGHNAGVVSIDSKGAGNVLGIVEFGARFQKLIVKGDAVLGIEDDLNFAWGTADVDASANTGGLRMTINSQVNVAGLSQVTVKGSSAKDVIAIEGTAAGVKLDIDLGAGSSNVLNLVNGIDAGRGSKITGENLTVNVVGTAVGGVGTSTQANPLNAAVNLTYADISGVDAFVIDSMGDATSLIISAAQFQALGADKFDALHRDATARLKVMVSSDTTLSQLVDLTKLDANVKLEFSIAQGATLTLSAQELDKYVATNGIVLGDGAPTTESKGAVVITNAGLNFDAEANGAVAAPGNAYQNAGGTIDNTWVNNQNLTIVRSVDGFDRASAANINDTLTIDTTAAAVTVAANAINEATEFDLSAKKMVLKGANDVTFTAPVDFEGANNINFQIDASGLTGKINGLTVAEFNNITSGLEATWGNVVGTAGADRINVQLTGDVGTGATVATGGLKSTGVETYVVTGLDVNRTFNVCDTTQGLTTLGLQGQAAKTITFNNTKFGVKFLMEGDGQADWTALPKAAGNPNTSNIGTLTANYFAYDPNFTADVTINNRGVALGLQTDGVTKRSLSVDGINIDNAKAMNITIADGNAVIKGINAAGANELESIKISSANDVTLALTESATPLKTFDAANVVGKMTLLISENATAVVDLSKAIVTGVDAIKVNENEALTLSFEQFKTIGSANITPIDTDGNGVFAVTTLNLVGLDETPFKLADLSKGLTLGTLVIASQADGVVTLAPTTDLTGVTSLTVPKGMTLNMTAAQFQQLNGAGTITGVDSTGAASTEFVVNITDLTTAEAAIDLSAVTARGLKYDTAGVHVLGDSGNITLKTGAGSVTFTSNLNNAGIKLLAAEEVTLTTAAQAHNRTIDAPATAKVKLNLTYVQIDQDQDGAIDAGDSVVAFKQIGAPDVSTIGLEMAKYSGAFTLEVLHTLVQGRNVEQILGHLNSSIIVDITKPAVIEGQPADPTNRVVIVESGVTVAATGGKSLIFANLEDKGLVKTLDLTLKGDVKVNGEIDISTLTALDPTKKTEYFGTLSIKSEGASVNELGDIRAGSDAANTSNDLLAVTINATTDLNVGEIFFSAVELLAGKDTVNVSDDVGKAATLTVTGNKNVTIKSLNTADGEVGTLNVVNNLTAGVLTITGASPTINDADNVGPNLETLNLTGAAMVFDTDAASTGINSATLSTIDASKVTGTLTLGKIGAVDNKSFKFVAPTTAVNKLTLDGVTLNDSKLQEQVLAYNKALAAYKGATAAEKLANPLLATDLTNAFEAVQAKVNGALYDVADKDPLDKLNAILTADQVVNAEVATKAVIDTKLVEWNFALNAASELTIKAATFTDGALKISGGKVVIDGYVDMRNLDVLTLTNVDLDLKAGAALALTDAQWAALPAAVQASISEAGTTLELNAATLASLASLNAAGTYDLSSLRGIKELRIPEAFANKVKLTAEQALVAQSIKANGAVSDDGATPAVALAKGDFTKLAGADDVTVLVTKSADTSTLKGVDVVDVKDDSAANLTIRDNQLGAFNAGTQNAVAALDELADLTIKSMTVTGKDVTTAKAKSEDLTVDTNFAHDATTGVAKTLSITGHAAAIDGMRDLLGTAADKAAFTALLAKAATVNHTLVGSELSTHSFDAAGNAAASVTLNGNSAAVDTFTFVAAPYTTGGAKVDIAGFTFGEGTAAVPNVSPAIPADVLNINAFLGAAIDASNGASTLNVGIAAGINLAGADKANVLQVNNIQNLGVADFAAAVAANKIATAVSSKYVVFADVAGDGDALQNIYFVETNNANVATVTLVGTINEGALAVVNLA